MRSHLVFYARDISGLVIALTLMTISAVVASLSIALIIHWTGEISVENFPYILIALSVATAFLAYQSFIQSFSFYRIRLSVVAVFLGIAVFSLGYALFGGGQVERLERALHDSPIYRSMVPGTAWDHGYAEDTDEREDNR
ncbi:MAG: hypothetical protein PHT88_01205 [Candidatus Moranbacteria bacterium]|nr:hypothetical protein [Candidatus Moranbacteria bacterium]